MLEVKKLVNIKYSFASLILQVNGYCTIIRIFYGFFMKRFEKGVNRSH